MAVLERQLSIWYDVVSGVDCCPSGWIPVSMSGSLLNDLCCDLRLLWHTRGFHTKRRDRFIARYSNSVAAQVAIDGVLTKCDQAMRRLKHIFGFDLPGVFTVLVLEDRHHVARVSGKCGIGWALARKSLIAVALESYPYVIDEILRHEFAHLFCRALNANAPRLFNEGLATWAAGSLAGIPLDQCASQSLGNMPLPRIDEMFVYDLDSSACYAAAGSFIGHVISTWGLPRFLTFYRSTADKDVRVHFEQLFGHSLDECGANWRAEVKRSRKVMPCEYRST